MAEGFEEPEVEAEQQFEPTSSAAVAIALDRVSRSRNPVAVDAEAAAFLRDQRRLVSLQAEHLHEQRLLILSRLRWGRSSDRLKAVLQSMTIGVGLIVGAAVAFMAWQAHEAGGLIIEPFSTPPDLAAQGLTGQVVASRLLDDVKRLQDQTISHDAPKALANDVGEEAKVEIPETGVSIGELQRLMRQWLGHETRVSGELTREGPNLTLTLRAGEEPADPVSGPAADPGALIAKAAEELYGESQPERYIAWLRAQDRKDDALKLLQTLSLSGDRRSRARALDVWARLLPRGQPELDKLAEALRLDPDNPDAWPDVAYADRYLGRAEPLLIAAERAAALWRGPRRRDFVDWYANLWRAHTEALAAETKGDRFGAARTMEAAGDPSPGEPVVACRKCAAGALLEAAQDYAAVGDGAGMRRATDRAIAAVDDPTLSDYFTRDPELVLAENISDWSAIAVALQDKRTQAVVDAHFLPWHKRAVKAEALAAAGRLNDAAAAVQGGDGDCYNCAVDVGRFAALAGDWNVAEASFARAFRLGPDLPLAHEERARMLIARGDDEAAISELSTAARLGPHSSRASELWGEALMKTGELKAAAERFAQADREAPRWGRNHLMWGEALMLARRYAEARAQFLTANGLDLDRPDRASLEVLLARTASGPLHG
jgi:tetratricopeptide (TPR) repeat protein